MGGIMLQGGKGEEVGKRNAEVKMQNAKCKSKKKRGASRRTLQRKRGGQGPSYEEVSFSIISFRWLSNILFFKPMSI
jgi:hypothetical protein